MAKYLYITLKPSIQSSSRSFYGCKAVLGVVRSESILFRPQWVLIFPYVLYKGFHGYGGCSRVQVARRLLIGSIDWEDLLPQNANLHVTCSLRSYAWRLEGIL
jgi:hypothetical protein